MAAIRPLINRDIRQIKAKRVTKSKRPPRSSQEGATMQRHTLYSIALAASFFAACGRTQVEMSTSVESGSLAAEHVGEKLLVNIRQIKVYVIKDKDSKAPSGQSSDNSFISVFEGKQSIDLFSPSELTKLLSISSIPPGEISQIRLVLDPEVTWSKGGETIPVQCSSCQLTGLKLVPSAVLEVKRGELLSIELLFDAQGSLTFDQSGARLDPVIHVKKLEELSDKRS
jgi:hypothetical protein